MCCLLKEKCDALTPSFLKGNRNCEREIPRKHTEIIHKDDLEHAIIAELLKQEGKQIALRLNLGRKAIYTRGINAKNYNTVFGNCNRLHLSSNSMETNLCQANAGKLSKHESTAE